MAWTHPWTTKKNNLKKANFFLFIKITKGSRKKKKVPPLVAGPLRGGEGGKGRATKEKRTFFKNFFFILLT